MRHPYYDYTLDDALKLAKGIKYGVYTKPSDPVPDILEAIEFVRRTIRLSSFNWITGRVALEVLRAGNGEKVDFTP
ncbi:MAG: hypothetical protein EG828_11530 [Deltaproteobacteria bacterium]|nr:hypothetical protein [Deltaproteobacteria bacterium]